MKKMMASALLCIMLATSCVLSDNSKYPSLNLYNTSLDDGRHDLRVGGLYTCDTKEPNLRYEVLQCLETGDYLIYRGTTSLFIDNKLVSCTPVILLLKHSQPYAEGAYVRKGVYKCIGTYRYPTRQESNGERIFNTVYAIEEMQESTGKSEKRD